MKEFLDLDIKYPELVIDVLEYFALDKNINKKSIANFCISYKKEKADNKEPVLPPSIITKICDILSTKYTKMSCINRAGVDGANNNYAVVIKDWELWNANKPTLNHYFNSLVYGFEYIYRYYLDIVRPLVTKTENGNEAMGACFKYNYGIVTAKHCLVDGDKVAIKGYEANVLSSAKVYTSKNESVDVAYIHMGEGEIHKSATPNILDEVLVMGFPMIPRFLNFITAEKATISSIADLRLTPTRGIIAALAPEMFSKTELLLLTARIKGGNSGGPVINNEGSVVGVAVSDPKSEGESYDDLGYGIAFPIQVVNDIIAENNTIDINFIDFPNE